MPQSLAASFASKFGSRGSISKEYRCTVQLLDDAETLQVEFKKGDNGQVIFDYVCECLNIVEKDYFGLRYMDSFKNRYWLDPNKPIMKQVKGSQPFVLRFRVKYYPSDPDVLKEEITRYQLFLQLRRDLLHGRLYCPHNDAAYLGAYIIQSELGDFSPEDQPDSYVSEYKLFLKQTAKLEDKIAGVHQTLQGLTPAEAELNFLQRASTLDTYGYDPYTVKDAKLGQIYLGVTHQGVLVYHANRKVHHIRWEEVEKVDYLGKDFYLYPKASYFQDDISLMGISPPAKSDNHALQPEEGGGEETPEELTHMDITTQDGTTTTIIGSYAVNNTTAPEDQTALHSDHSSAHSPDSEEKKRGKANSAHILKYQCPSATFCKHLWKYTLAQQAFFTVPKASQVKHVTSRRRIPILQRGSTFRFPDRCLGEIKEDVLPEREQPSFTRVHLEKQPSRAERGFPWMNKYNTLPRSTSKNRSQANAVEMEKQRSKEAPEPRIERDITLDSLTTPHDTTDDKSPICEFGGGFPEAEMSLQASAPSPGRESAVDNGGIVGKNPLCNSTPVKPPSSGRLFRNTSSTSQNGPTANGGTSVKKMSLTPTEEKKGVKKTGGGSLCGKIMKYVFGSLLFLIIFCTVMIALMEVKDRQFRGYVHTVPGMESFRHLYYEPSRRYMLSTYNQLLSGKGRAGSLKWW